MRVDWEALCPKCGRLIKLTKYEEEAWCFGQPGQWHDARRASARLWRKAVTKPLTDAESSD